MPESSPLVRGSVRSVTQLPGGDEQQRAALAVGFAFDRVLRITAVNLRLCHSLLHLVFPDGKEVIAELTSRSRHEESAVTYRDAAARLPCIDSDGRFGGIAGLL